MASADPKVAELSDEVADTAVLDRELEPSFLEQPLPLPVPEAAAQEQARPGRLLALDALRGLTIALMLLVNNVALDIYTPKQLTHAPWNGGVRVADFVFPWFLFCVGLAIPFSAASFRRKKLSAWHYDLKVVRRAAVLVLLGCLLDSSIAKRPLFTLGVLQIIGLAYLVGALLYDLPLCRRLIVAGGLLAAYWAILKFVPIPGVGAGVFLATQNLVAYVNRIYLMGLHLAGLPSVIPTAALVLIGTVIGDLVRSPEADHRRKLAWLLLGGLGLVVGGELWALSVPLNKALWTPSFMLLSAGTGAIVLGFFYLLIDSNGWRAWSYPLLVFGSNAILAYVVPILVKVLVLQVWQVSVGGRLVPMQQWFLDYCVNHSDRVVGGWLYTLGFILAWWLVLWQLYRRKVFFRV